MPEVTRQPPKLPLPSESRDENGSTPEPANGQKPDKEEIKQELGFGHGIGVIYGVGMLGVSLVSFYILYKAWRGNPHKEFLNSTGSQRSYDGQNRDNLCSPIELKTGWVQVFC